jgi:hypothetical protein
VEWKGLNLDLGFRIKIKEQSRKILSRAEALTLIAQSDPRTPGTVGATESHISAVEEIFRRNSQVSSETKFR